MSNSVFNLERREIGQPRELQRELLAAADEERRRIGQDLHDDTGQVLTGLRMLAEVLEETLRKQSLPEADLAAKIVERAKRALAQVQALSRGLLAVEVSADRLPAALAALANEIGDQCGTACEFKSDGPVMLDDNMTATHLYRIAQEALTNAVKHGKGRHVKVRLEAKGDELTLQIMDDGIGLQLSEAQGQGIRNMHHRADLIQAKLRIEGVPEGGTVVCCTLSRGK